MPQTGSFTAVDEVVVSLFMFLASPCGILSPPDEAFRVYVHKRFFQLDSILDSGR